MILIFASLFPADVIATDKISTEKKLTTTPRKQPIKKSELVEEAGLDSLMTLLPDSLQSALVGSLSVKPVVRRWWREQWLLDQLGLAGGERLLDREVLFTSSGLVLANSIGTATRLGELRAGSQGIGNLLYQYAPALERSSIWFQGQTTTGAAIPEGWSSSLSSLPIGELRWINPDPIIDPLGEGGDGMLWAGVGELEWLEVPSAIRVIEGRNNTTTEEAILAREAGPLRLFASLSHFSSDGRAVYANSRYQHMLMQLDRATPWGVVRVSGVTRSGRYKMTEGRKQNWGADFLEIGWQSSLPGSIGVEARLLRRNDLLRWWGIDEEGRRSSRSTGFTSHLTYNAGKLTLLSSQAVDWTSLSYRANTDQENINLRFGSGFAVGARWETGRLHGSASVGVTNPWWDESHLRGRFLLRAKIGKRLSTAVEGWRGGGMIFDPQLEPRGMSLIRQGIRLPGGESILNEKQRRIEHFEWRGEFEIWRLRATVGFFTRELENALGLDREGVGESRSELLSGRYSGLVSTWKIVLPLRTYVEGDFTGFLDPAADELSALIPPYRGRVVFGLRRLLFTDELDLDLRLVGEFMGEWLTPEGLMPATSRFDGELHARIGPMHILIDLMNLESDIRESATYDNGWVMQPLRAYRTGIEWHFKD